MLMHIRDGLQSLTKLAREEEYIKRIDKFKKTLQTYMQFNNDARFYGSVYGGTQSNQQDFQKQWYFWVRKLMQHKLLPEFLDILPRSTSFPSQDKGR